MIDFSALRDSTKTFAESLAHISKADLYQTTNEIIDTELKIIAAAVDADVTFVPRDPQASSGDETGWTLGHVIVHATASSEESAALSTTLARGVQVQGRSRYETPWESVHSVEQLRKRLEESRRIRLAFLDAWPDEPHLDVTNTPFPQAGQLNAISQFALGLAHEQGHLTQLQEIVRQAKEAR